MIFNNPKFKFWLSDLLKFNNSSPKATSKAENGSATSIIGNGNQISNGLTAKELATINLKAAIGDLDYNSRRGTGGQVNPFKYLNIEKVLCLPIPYELNQELHNKFSEYLHSVGICNGYNGIPGRVQNQSKILKECLQEHLKRIANLN